MKRLTLLLVLLALAGCSPVPYRAQDRYDQWAASCRAAEARDPARCALILYQLDERRRFQQGQK